MSLNNQERRLLKNLSEFRQSSPTFGRLLWKLQFPLLLFLAIFVSGLWFGLATDARAFYFFSGMGVSGLLAGFSKIRGFLNTWRIQEEICNWERVAEFLAEETKQ